MVAFAGALVGLYLPPERDGQGLVEYSLIIVLVAIVVILMLAVTGGAINNVYSRISNSLATSGI